MKRDAYQAILLAAERLRLARAELAVANAQMDDALEVAGLLEGSSEEATMANVTMQVA